MKSLAIKAEKRKELGSKHAATLRRQGMVPCVIYGAGENVHFYADVREISKALITPEVYKVVITVDGKTYETVVQSAQFHPVTDRPVHVDFFQLSADKPVVIALPVRTVGTSQGVRAGGKLRVNLRKMKVKGLPGSIPDQVTVNIEELKIGDFIRVGDLKTEGIEFVDPKNLVVAAVKTSRGVAADAPADAAKAAPAAAAAKAPAAPAAAAKAPAKK